MAALTVVFDLDGTLVDTAPDLIDTLNVVFAREGLPPVAYDAARNMIGGGARRMIEAGLQHRGPRLPSAGDVDRLFADFIAVLRRPYRRPLAAVSGPRRSPRSPGRARLPLCGLHQQARRAVAAAARCARPHPALCGDLRPGHVRDAQARSRDAAPDHPRGRRRRCDGRSWSAIPAPISPPRAPPAFRWWRSISATAKRRSRNSGADRLISHFDELAGGCPGARAGAA